MRGLALPGHGRETLTLQEQTIRDLERKLIDVEMERGVFKKAMAIFSRKPNILDRNFTVGSPNKARVSHITYLKIGRK